VVGAGGTTVEAPPGVLGDWTLGMLGMLMLGMLGMLVSPPGTDDFTVKKTIAPAPIITASTTPAITRPSPLKPVAIDTLRGPCWYGKVYGVPNVGGGRGALPGGGGMYVGGGGGVDGGGT
jgi:hypothetical protein